MAIKPGPNDWLVQVATVAYRNPDGTFGEGIPLYELVPEKEVNLNTSLTEGEEKANMRFVKEMSKIFSQAMKANKAMNQGKAAAEKVRE